MNNDYAQILTDQRNKVWHEAKALVDHCVAEKREMSGEEREQYERMNADIDRLDKDIRGIMDRAQNDREADQARAAFEPILNKPEVQATHTRQVSVLEQYFRGQVAEAPVVDFSTVAREKELIRSGASEHEIRALYSDTGSSGSLIPTEFARNLYGYMEAANSILRISRVITTSGGENMDFPKVAAHAIGTQVKSQGTALAGTDPTFDKMTLGAYKYGELVQLSTEFVSDSAVDILGFIAQDVGRALGRVTATAYATGGGSTAPNGVMTAAVTGSLSTGGSLITVDLDDLINLQYSVVDMYRQSPNCAYLFNDYTAGSLRLIRETGGTDGQYLWQPAVIAGQPDRLLGFPVYTDSNIATHGSNAKVAAFGDFSAYYIRNAGPLRFERSDDFAFNTDLVSFRGVLRTDADLIDDNAIKILKQSV